MLSILKAIGSLLFILGVLMLIVPLIDIAYSEPFSKYFFYIGLINLALGALSSLIKGSSLTTLEALVTAGLGWVLIPIDAAFALSLELRIRYIDALFESVSGFTGTGFTVLTPSTLKHSILFWRSLMQWTGELGFVVFAMVLIPYFYSLARTLYGVERPLKIESTFYRTALRLIAIYLVLTMLGTFFYVITGMSFFDAVNQVMTTVATGGMSTYDNGYNFIFRHAPLTYYSVLAFMVLGGMNFLDLHKLFTGRIGELIRSEELKYYVYSLIGISIATSISYYSVENVHSVIKSLELGVFNTISGMTTTGFSIGSLSALSGTTKAVITLGMFIGGMTFSTAGGIKSFRLMLLMKKIKHYTQSLVSPSSMIREISVAGRRVSEADISAALLFVIFHASIIFLSAIIISGTGFSFINSLFETTSAASCVGLSTGVISIRAPDLTKSVIITDMLLGRIEYLHILLLLALIFGKRTIKLTHQ